MATATAQTTNTPAQRELERRMLRQMLSIRRFEEKAAEAYALGNIGAFHETLNMASVYKLPVIFVCENNRYGMGTAFERVAAVTDVVEHACSYDMAAELVNGMDVLAVYDATRRAAERARKGGRPTLLDVRP